jgi:lysophospholipase L1-like esterase/mannose-6-phosphate isomerase-like protein (cupin superfamily)
LAEPVTIFLAGDSTMAEKLAEKRPETGWGEMLGAWFPSNQVIVSNHAMNGRSTRTFIEEGRWKALLADVRQGDYVLIQFGHNDQSERKPKRYTPPADFKANLSRFVADVRERGAEPVLLTPVVRRRFDENGNFYDTHGPYPDLTRQVAIDTGAALIDHHASSRWYLEAYGAERSKELFLILAPGESPNYPDGLDDNTHFSPYGARAMASLVMQAIPAASPGLAPYLVKAQGGIRRDEEVARPMEAPHDGGGEATGHWYFADAEKRPFAFRKTVLHPGAAIGYHLHDNDEVYYIIEGSATMLFNGSRDRVGPGTAIFTRKGDSHGLVNDGDSDVEVVVVFTTGES